MPAANPLLAVELTREQVRFLRIVLARRAEALDGEAAKLRRIAKRRGQKLYEVEANARSAESAELKAILAGAREEES